MADDFNLERFIQNLIEAVVWCHHHLSGSDDPSILWTVTDEKMTFTYKDNERVKPFYHRVIAARSDQVAPLLIPEYEDLLPLIQEGRLVIFLYTCTTSDTAAAAESDGFFDPHNSPPWATWVYHIDASPDRVEYVIAWIPPQFLKRAGYGIGSCSDESILWLTENETILKITYADDLKAAGLWL